MVSSVRIDQFRVRSVRHQYDFRNLSSTSQTHTHNQLIRSISTSGKLQVIFEDWIQHRLHSKNTAQHCIIKSSCSILFHTKPSAFRSFSQLHKSLLQFSQLQWSLINAQMSCIFYFAFHNHDFVLFDCLTTQQFTHMMTTLRLVSFNINQCIPGQSIVDLLMMFEPDVIALQEIISCLSWCILSRRSCNHFTLRNRGNGMSSSCRSANSRWNLDIQYTSGWGTQQN